MYFPQSVEQALSSWESLCRTDGNMTHSVGEGYCADYPVGEWGVVLVKTMNDPLKEAAWDLWLTWLDELTIGDDDEEPFFTMSVVHFTTTAHIIVLKKSLIQIALGPGMLSDQNFEDRFVEVRHEEELKLLESTLLGICKTYFFDDRSEDPYNEEEENTLPLLSEFLSDLHHNVSNILGSDAVHESGGLVWRVVDYKNEDFINAIREALPIKTIWQGLHDDINDSTLPYDFDHDDVPLGWNWGNIKSTATLVAVMRDRFGKDIRGLIGFTSDEILFDDDVEIAYEMLGWLTYSKPYQTWCVARTDVDDPDTWIVQPTKRCIKLSGNWYTFKAYETIQKRLP